MTNDKSEYFNVLIPDLIKDVAKQAVSGNDQAKQRLEVIRNFAADTLDAIDNKPKPFFKDNFKPKRGSTPKKR